MRIRTPEGVEFTLDVAGPAARMLALATDLAAVAVASSVLTAALGPLKLISTDLTEGVATVLFFVLSTAYGMALEWAWRGQTIGKRVFGLRVMDVEGRRIHPSQIVVRNLFRMVDMLPAFYLVGAVAAILSQHRQRLGDLAARTVVVRTGAAPQPDLSQLLGGKYNSLLEYGHLAARLRQQVRPEAAGVALETLMRRDELAPDSRVALFRDLAAYFRSLVAFPPEAVEQLSDEQYVRNVVEALYRTRRPVFFQPPLDRK